MAGGELGSSSTKSEPNVVPLCDILLVLLIIFMVVTPMIQKGANVTLPEAKNTQEEPQPGEMITVDVGMDRVSGELKVFLESKVIDDVTKLATAIEDIMEEKQIMERKILLKADIDLEYGKVVDVMNEIRSANIEILGLVTEKFAGSD
jgi:biopolymer transport protein TolR